MIDDDWGGAFNGAGIRLPLSEELLTLVVTTIGRPCLRQDEVL